MLSEVRAYGEGFLIAEQIPTKLAPDVIKNTALKIMHRVVANDDREVMGGAMNLSMEQLRHVVALKKGEAVVHGGGDYGDDNAILVQVPRAKDKGEPDPTEEEIRAHWEDFINRHHLAAIFCSYPTCLSHCNPLNLNCSDAHRVAEHSEFVQVFATMIVSLVAASFYVKPEHLPSLLNRFYEPLRRVLRKEITGRTEQWFETRCILTHALYHYMDKRGQQYRWMYNDTVRMVSLLLPALLAVAESSMYKAEEESASLNDDQARNLTEFCQNYGSQCIQEFGPFYGCNQVEQDDPQHLRKPACQIGQTDKRCLCLYRYSVAPFLYSLDFEKAYQQAGIASNQLVARACRYAQRVTQLDHNSREFRSAALCFLIQRIHRDERLDLISQSNLINNCIDFYDKPNKPPRE